MIKDEEFYNDFETTNFITFAPGGIGRYRSQELFIFENDRRRLISLYYTTGTGKRSAEAF